MEAFTAGQVTEITDVKLNRLQNWMDNGWVAPSREKAAGKGTRNKFSREDIYMIGLFKKLVESGFSRKLAGRFFKYFNERPGYPMRSILTARTDDECWFEIHNLDDGEWRVRANTGVKYSIGPKPKFELGKPLEDVLYMISINITKIMCKIDEKINQLK